MRRDVLQCASFSVESRVRAASVLMSLLLAAGAAAREPATATATLAGHAILPAASFVAPPRGAPADTRRPGAFTGADNLRHPARASVPSRTAPGPEGRPTGLALPFRGQAVQGISAMAPARGGRWWALSDNGFGTRRNSSDALLALHELSIDFARGTVRRERTVFLRDPARRIGFRLVHEATNERYLTGADFDPESLQVVGDAFWIGDEFGPFLLEFDRQGTLRRLVEARLDGRPLRSPDHPALQLPATPGETVPFAVARSGGFESLALAPDGGHLWAVLEKPLFDERGVAEAGQVRALEFDLARGDWSGRSLRIPLAPGASSVGDLNLLSPGRAVMLERDGGEGSPRLACTDGRLPPGCFAQPARLRQLVWIALPDDAAAPARRLQVVDLLDIADPLARARRRGDGAPPAGRFDFPFATPETVLPVGRGRLLLANDNNLPFSAGRFLDRADDTEFVLLDVEEPTD
jgi:hypothetical protein